LIGPYRRYRLIQDIDATHFDAEINNHLSEGWELYGETHVSYNPTSEVYVCFAQAMVFPVALALPAKETKRCVNCKGSGIDGSTGSGFCPQCQLGIDLKNQWERDLLKKDPDR
jgi:hypothetical protein